MTTSHTTKRKRSRVGLWVLASLLLHAVVGVAILRFAGAFPVGEGNGASREGSLSLTWIPGSGKETNERFDTSLPASVAVELTAASDLHELDNQPVALIQTAEFQVEDVFQTESSSLKEDVEAQKERGRSPIKLASAVKPQTVEPEPKRLDEATESASQPNKSRSKGSTKSGQGTKGDQSKPNAGRTGGNAGGEVGFFGITTRARRVVYLIDASESMRQYDAIGLARRELSESLRTLELSSQFQVIFFDVKTHAMYRADNRLGLLQATTKNLNLAERFMKGIQPNSGTDRFAALKLALSFEPDAIFLLTDADEPVMSDRELRDLHRLNQRGTAINVVEYCFDENVQAGSFLERLAQQNRGQHYFCDVKAWASESRDLPK